MTATIITQTRLKELLYYNKQFGIFVWKKRNNNAWNARHEGKIAGSINSNGYAHLRINRVAYYNHRLALLYVDGVMPPQDVDHINGDKTDNSYKNLRYATRAINAKNTKLRTKSKTGISGVSETLSGKWIVYVWENYKKIFLGTHDCFFDACCSRKSAELRHGYHKNHGRGL